MDTAECLIQKDTKMVTEILLEQIATLDSKEFRAFQEQVNCKRWTAKGFPEKMYPWFKEGISKHRGDKWEEEFKQACSQLLDKLDESHDATIDPLLVKSNNLKGNKVEIKFFTSMLKESRKDSEKRGYALTWAERAVDIPLDKNKNVIPSKSGTWQQVKPTCADYGLFSVLYGNGAVHYWMPYHLLSRTPGKDHVEAGKVPMGIQHKDHATEGQVDIKPRFHELFFLDVTFGTPFITDLSKYDLSKYDTVVY
jgi:hypothetical protein